ncbi:hypothetical protein HYW74_00880 [Candidatus Pacearchaeota archaeon]|nr:hypothetical protein [Candidatus Pacearchaeota archaeon]
MTTEEQVKANRENARKSTGPKDTSLTNMNALKHGITSKKILEQNKEEIQSIYQELCECFKPKDYMEYFFIGIMAKAKWKLNRITYVQCVNDANEQFSDKEWKETWCSHLESAPKIESRDELIQRYEKDAENSFYRALEMLIKWRKDKLGSFFENEEKNH